MQRTARSNLVLRGIVATAIATTVGCQSPGYHTASGAAIGGLTGAAIGAMAGADSGQSLQGAAIGAAAGGSLGGLVGNQADRAESQMQAVRQANYAEAAGRAVSPQQVVQMVQSGLSDQVISEQIRTNGVTQSLNVDELVHLKQSGVSDALINAMQQARTPGAALQPVSPPGGTTIIREHWVGPPPGFYAPAPCYPCPPPFRRGGIHWRVHF